MRTLVLIRHAKTEPHRDPDHSRELSPRGREDAVALRVWLDARGLHPGRVLVSTATRTRQTWEGCSVGSVAASYEDRVYEASADDLREVIAETAPSVQVLLLVGHNPSVEQLAWLLDDADGARDRSNSGMRTAGVAVFSVTDWELGDARLVDWR